MATTDSSSTADTPPDQALATTLDNAEFVHLLVAAHGDAVAAAGVLGRGLTEVGTPFQASVVTAPRDAGRRIEAGDGDTTAIGIGVDAADVDIALESAPYSSAAYAAVDTLESGVGDAVVALAGVVAGGHDIETAPTLVEAVEADAGQRTPGVAVPTTDVADGLVHSTLVRGPFSGAPAETDTRLGDLDTDADLGGRDVASMVAIATTGDETTPTRAAAATERALHPIAIDSPFETVAGFGDVLEATARTAPGTAIGLSLGHDIQDTALERWRDHGRAVHTAVDDADWDRYQGLVTVSVDAPVAATARLLRDYHSPEPAVLVTDGDTTALATSEAHAVEVLATATTRADVIGNDGLATTTTETDLEAVREALE